MTDAALTSPSPEEALASKVAFIINGLSADAAIVFQSARGKIDALEQTVLTSATKAKSILDDHVRLVLEVKEEVAKLSVVVEKVRADHARLVNAETGP